MREANRPVLLLEHMCSHRGLERVLRHTRVCDQPCGRTASRGNKEQGLPCGERKRVETLPYEPIDRVGNMEGLHWIDVRSESSGELEREERVSSRDVVHAQESW